MKILFYLGHPAHYHLFKYVIKNLKDRGVGFDILIKKKDVLEDLIKSSEFIYKNIQPKERSDSILGIAIGFVKRDIKILMYSKKIKPDLLVGTSAEITHVGKILNIPSIVCEEDDYNIIPLFSYLGYPFASKILSPLSCNNGKWESKSVKYNGFHKLAYLHPNYFVPSINKISNFINTNKDYFLIRFAKLTAHHDKGKTGITKEIALGLIEKLKEYGNIYISSERPLEQEFEQYRIKIPPNLIHDVLYYSKIYIGDSQSMAVEAAVLGVPGIRFNDFVGKIGVLEELQNKYKLTLGIKTDQKEKLFSTIQEMLKEKDLRKIWQERRKRLLNDKIDVTEFFTNYFIEYIEK